MNKVEFEAWKVETALSIGAWRLDRIHSTPEDSLFFKGGVDGHFLNVTKNCVIMGRYFGAIPHIGDAVFFPTGVVTFRDNVELWQRLKERASVPGLLDAMKRT